MFNFDSGPDHDSNSKGGDNQNDSSGHDNNNKPSSPGQNGNGGNNGGQGGNNNNNNNNNNGNNGNANTSPIKFPTQSGCKFVNENDGRLHYSGTWVLETKDPSGLRTTTHTTTTPGSQMTVTFNGVLPTSFHPSLVSCTH